MFDKKGYLRLTDLGVARIWKPENSSDTSGTPGYMGNQNIMQLLKLCADVITELRLTTTL